MKKTIYLALAAASFLLSCQRDQVVNIPVVSAKGVFVLYEGLFNTPSSFDYAFINLTNDSVYSNVYQNSNNGAFLNSFPDGMQLYLNQTLYVTAQGSFGNPGTIYKINSESNQLIASTNFGSNPYSLTIVNNKIFATNLAGSSVTQLDPDLNIVMSSIPVGPNPADLIYALGRIYVAKTSYTVENSLSVFDINSPGQVDKIFFNAPPVSVANNTGGVYVSAYTERKLYVLDSFVAAQIDDSIDLRTYPAFTNAASGDIISGDPRTLFIVGVDTLQFANVGKAVYKFDILTESLSLIISDPEISNIYGISYEPINALIYIADNNGGITNGEVRVYNTSGSLVKSYSNIGGRFPKRFAFKYLQE